MKAGQLSIRWLDDVECDLRIMGIHGWRSKVEDREEWKHIAGVIKACNRLKHQR